MFLQRISLLALTGIVAVAVVGCGGQMLFQGSGTSPVVAQHLDAERVNVVGDASGALQIVAQGPAKSPVFIGPGGKRLGALPGPFGILAVDSRGTVYDNVDNPSRVLVFEPPYKESSRTLGFGGDYVTGTAVDYSSGLLGVTLRKSSHGQTGLYYFEMFRSGSRTPCAVVQSPGSTDLYAGAFDKEGTLFAFDTDASGRAGVTTTSGGCGATGLRFNTFPAFAIDANANAFFNLNDDFVFQSGRTIYTFAHPINDQFGNPVAETTLKTGNLTTAFMYLSRDGTHLWAVPFYRGVHTSLLSEYNYPGGGNPIFSEHIRDVQVAAEMP